MKRSTASVTALAAALMTASVTVPGGTASARPPAPVGPHYYTTKTPYAPQEDLRHYQSPPKGFAPVFAENVVRHGSRAMTHPDDGDAVLAVLQNAQAQHALTELGARLAPQVQQLLAGGASIGYSNLAGRGKQEQRDIALRMERRLPALFATIVAKKEQIQVVTSGVDRVVASAGAFTGGLTAGDPALAGLIQAPVTDKDLLYFHKQPQNADYQEYIDSDPDLAAVLDTIDAKPATARTAKHVISRLFDRGFATAMPADDQIAFSRSLYELYSTAPDLTAEAPNVDLDPFLPPEDAHWFAYLDDAEEFYLSGPAFQGRTITYGMAGVLLDDLFAKAGAATTTPVAAPCSASPTPRRSSRWPSCSACPAAPRAPRWTARTATGTTAGAARTSPRWPPTSSGTCTPESPTAGRSTWCECSTTRRRPRSRPPASRSPSGASSTTWTS